VHQGTRRQTCHLWEIGRPLHYNSLECPVKHRAVSGVTPDCLLCQRSNGYSRATVDYNAFNARLRAQRTEHAQLVHRTVYRTCPVHHRTAQRPHKSELQRSADVAGALDSVRWPTGLSGAPCESSLPTTIFWWLGL
jgi:aminoglycoside phosphotransferase